MHNIETSYFLSPDIWNTALDEDKNPTSFENIKMKNKRK